MADDKLRRCNPCWSEYHWKIITSQAHIGGTTRAAILKHLFAVSLENKSEKQLEQLITHYQSMNELEKKNPEK